MDGMLHLCAARPITGPRRNTAMTERCAGAAWRHRQARIQLAYQRACKRRILQRCCCGCNGRQVRLGTNRAGRAGLLGAPHE